MNDIDLSSVCGESLNGGTSWNPIGNSVSNSYEGTFNGDGHTISGLYINSSSANDQGLFGYVSGSGKIEKLSVSGDINGNNYVGGVVGLNLGSVENCHNTGTVTGTGDYVGGVVGDNRGSVINCYNTGTVSGNRVGGVVGYNISSVTNCYNTGTVTGTDGYVGGVVGYNISGNVTGCYFLQTADVNENLSGIGGGSAEGAKSLTADQFKNQNSFTDWDFGIADTDTWTIHSVLGRPVLNENWEGGDGLPDSPYEISTADQLENFRDIVNGASRQVKDSDAHAKLMNNIDLKDVCGPELDAETSWTPIGNSEENAYTGTFDGNGNTIENLYINNTTNDYYQGLFGCLDQGGTVQNLSVSGTVNSSGDYVGGIVGNNSGNVTVQNCTFSGDVSSSGDLYVGGVVGYNNGGTVTGCIFSGSGSVSGSEDVGGVVGRNDGTVENCYNTGKVSGNRYVGGVVGYNGSSSTVENCHNTGAVNSSGNYVGGVVGHNISSVTNCYNTGSVTRIDSTYVGGVVGWNDGANVTNCYFLQTADVNENLSGIGKNEGTSSNVEARTADEFRSGEVAYLLQGTQTTPVWGQNDLNTDKSWPTLVALDNSAQPVYQVTFDYGTSFTDIDERFAYSYTNGVVSKPTKNPELDGHTLSGWYSDESLTTAWNFSTAVTKNMTLYAKWTAVEDPEPEPEEPPYTGKYSYEVFTSVGDNGTVTVDRYATEGEKVTISVSPDEAYKLDDLSVTANGKDVALTDNGDGTFSFTMPSADVRITATFAEDPDWTEPEEPATDVSDIFLDIAPDAWYKDAIQYAYDNGLMTGTSANEFAPEQTTTRAMIVSILARLENVTSAEAAGFADVDDEWYATAVNWAANVGVVNGYEDNTFQPNTAITREQLAAILMNYAAYKGEDVSARVDLSAYTDQPSAWAEETMSWAVAEGLISGVTADTLQPQGAATRAQVAAILQRFLSE